MSQEQAKTYLAAAEKAQAAANAALPALASADAALKSAQGARAVLQKTLQNTTDSAQKAELSAALKQFDATVLNPARTAFNVAKSNVDNPLRSAQQLREQANTASNSADNSVNTTPLGNLADKDATSYPAPDPYYPNEGASGPTLVAEERLTTVEIPNVVPVGTPATDNGVVQTFGVSSTGGATISNPPSESTIVPRRVTLPSAPPIGNAPAVQAATATSTQNTIVKDQSTLSDEEILARQPLGQIQTSPSALSDEEIIVRRSEDNAIRARNSAINIASLEGVDTTGTQTQLAGNIRTGNVAGGTEQARGSSVATAVSITNAKDLRVRISLAKEANYMYNVASDGDILKPLERTNGVIFPYTPQITIGYSANYDSVDVTHSNYKLHHYRNSSVDSINIIGDFTAQDTSEANYLLAVIHFFKCVTKMFYGKDTNPTKGAPPPLCYLSGYGAYAFDMHPILIQTFSLSYPNDVDYINAGAPFTQGQQLTEYAKPTFQQQRGMLARIAGLKSSGVAPGGVTSKKPFATVTSYSGITRVPTKMTITITALPVITRNNVSNYFSLREYSTGALLKNTKGYGGTW